jgi:hypothetical protein
VPVIGAPVPGVPPMLGLLMPGAVLESMVGEVLNVPDPVIGAGPAPGVGPNVPIVPDGATGDTPVEPPVAPVAAPGAAVCAKDKGAAAINAAATAGTMDFRLSMRVSFEIAERKPSMPQAACPGYSRFATSSSITSVAPPPIDWTRASRVMRSMADSRM